MTSYVTEQGEVMSFTSAPFFLSQGTIIRRNYFFNADRLVGKHRPNVINNYSKDWYLSEIKLLCLAHRCNHEEHDLCCSGHDTPCVLCRAGSSGCPQLLFPVPKWWDRPTHVHRTSASSELEIKYGTIRKVLSIL